MSMNYPHKPSFRSLVVLILIISIIAGAWYIHTIANVETIPEEKQSIDGRVNTEVKNNEGESDEEEVATETRNRNSEEREAPDYSNRQLPPSGVTPEEEEEEAEIIQYSQVQDPVNGLDDFQAGTAVLLYAQDYKDMHDMEWKLEMLFNRLVDANVNSVSLTFPISQDDISSTTLKTTNKTPRKEELGYFLEKARERGFFTTLRPLIDERNFTGNDWRGTIRPSNHNAWFESYTELMVEYAELAEEEGVDVFSIGVELTSMENYPDHWIELIEEVRNVYSGYITYASNSGISAQMPWEELDLISVDAFFHIDAPDKNATKQQIVGAWQYWVERIEKDAKRIGKPVVFSELGVTSQQGSYTHSWRWNHGTSTDMESQRIYYEASCEAWKNKIDGIYWWAANIWSHEEPEQDPGFNPMGKPAELEIAKCFS